MNGTRDSLDQLKAIAAGVVGPLSAKVDTLICPPSTLLYVATALATDSPLAIGAQDCHTAESGAHTGDISAAMIADCYGTYVLVGHSERRTDHKEDDALVRAKAEAAHKAGLTAIVCIGETGDERKAGTTIAVLTRQLIGSVPDGATAENTVIAYEPVWAIGTGLTPTAADVEEAHAASRRARLAFRRCRQADAHPLWRLGQAFQRGRADGRRQCRRRADRRRELEGGGRLPRHLWRI